LVGRSGFTRSACAVVFLLLLLALLPHRLHAQATLGALRGLVIDDDFRQPISGVSVRLEENGVTAQTDGNGKYVFNGLPPGAYTVSATREAYRLREKRQIGVSAGAVSEVTLEMIGEVLELEDLVVNAEELVSAEPSALLDIRASAMAIGDVIGADFIAKVGGGDIGDVVKRIVGTSVADSRYVVIRGLSDRYNTVLLNGARIPSSDPDKRAVNIDIFPSNLVGELTNTKTFTPDLPGESTGGSINIVTKSSPAKPFVNASIVVGVNNQSTDNARFLTYRGAGTGILGTSNDRTMPAVLRGFKTRLAGTTEETNASAQLARRLLDPTTGTTNGSAPPLDFNFSASVGTQFADFLGGPLGVLAAFTYSKRYEFDDSVRRGQTLFNGPPGSVSKQRAFVFDSQESSEALLSGLLLTSGWQPTPNDTLKVTVFANLAAEDRAFYQEGLVIGSTQGDPNTVTIGNSEDIAIREGLLYVERRLRTAQISGVHSFPALADASLNWAAAYSLSSQDEPDGRFASATFLRETGRITQLPEFRGPPSTRYWRRLDDTDYNILAEFKIPLFRNADGTEKALIRLGTNFDYSTREYRADTFEYDNIFLSNLFGVEDPSDRKGQTAADLAGRQASLFRRINPETYNATQVIAAAFLAADFNLGQKFRVNVGLRGEITDMSALTDRKGFFRPNGEPEGDPPAPGPIADVFGGTIPADQRGIANIEQVDVLPALSATWDFATNMKLRFAGSRTVARPSIKEIAQVNIFDPLTTAAFRGNRLLEISTIDNVDLRWEWFPSPGDVLAISAFTKFIQKPIERFTNPRADFFANQDSAVIYGFEFEVQKGLGFLAEELRHLSIGFNGTKLYSAVELAPQARAERAEAGLEPRRRLQGQPDYLLNFNLSYDNKDLGLFAGVFLNVTGETLYQAGAQDGVNGFAADLYQQPVTSLDFTLSKKLNEQFKFTLRVENLLNQEVERVAAGNVDFARSPGTRYSMSMSGAW